MSATFASGSIKPPIHDQIAELQRKIQQLEGEKSAYYESSQNSLKENRERILQLREENRRLRTRLAHARDEQIISEVFHNRSDKAAFRNMSVKEAVKVLDQQVCDKVKKLNAMKHTTRMKWRQLEELQAQYDGLRAERRSPQLCYDSFVQQNLRMLENRLEKVQLKSQAAEHIMRSYLKMKEQLQEESLTFQPQLDQMEAEILKKKQELRELQAMNNDAHLSKETAKAELQCQEEQVYRERRDRELILNQYKKQMEERRAQAERGERRAQRVALHPDELSSEAQRSGTGVGEEERVISSFEEAYQHIREVTGVTNTQEMVDRFVSQQDTQKHLEKMKVENEVKLQQLKEERDTLLARFQEMKFSGETKHARRVLEEAERHLQEEQQRRDAAKEKLDSLTHTLTIVSAAVEHLTDKLQHISLDEAEVNVLLDSSERVVEQLHQAEQKLQRLQEELQGKDLNTLLKEMEEEEFLASIEGKLPHYNTRITLPETHRADLYEGETSTAEVGDFVHRTTISGTLHKSGLYGRVARKSHFSKISIKSLI
uniref:ODAD1 central coiled coil region domain-containing protein n=1 Tax=Pygocentrus nattereri TaxID=42514 RepID=A0AAR2KVW8_PYGNA